jgi:diaminopimelate decarboxylase
MLLPDSATRDGQGRLHVGGCDVAELAERHGTPLYLFDEATIRARLHAYRLAIDAWPHAGDVLYSAKAYFGLAMARLVVEEGCGVDVVSGGELEIALRGGVPAARIGFPGNNKSRAEVEAAARLAVGHLVVDSDHELDLIASLPDGLRVRGLLRLSPGVDPDTHEYISTGQLDSKFGFSVENRSALHALERAQQIAALDVRGVHMHIGSQILDLRSYERAIASVADFLAAARDQLGFTAGMLSVGGGLGIAHTDHDDPPTVAELMQTLTRSVIASFGHNNLPLPALYVEPGRSVVGSAGLAVYTVGARKEIPGVRTYLSVDGGMADNLRPKLYGALYQPVPVVLDTNAPLETVTLAGRYCESTDILVEEARLPHLQPGDLVALPAAGAYTLSMSSNYNAATRPAVVFVRDGVDRVVRRRETLDDWLAAEIG